MKPVGLYVHFPFCAAKCPYCDFYSLRADSNMKTHYADVAAASICDMRKKYGLSFDTVYFGGGTPSITGANNLRKIANCITSENGNQNITEFTVECNPSYLEDGFFDVLASCGVNRISLGLQSAIDSERHALGRKGTVADVSKAVRAAMNAGITNISLDLMLGIPEQTLESLKKSVEFCAASGAKHVSSYLLKIEKGTPFYKKRDNLTLPNEEESAEIYLSTCELLEDYGFTQYEISNFSNKGFESRHNLKYWNGEEYLGVGPAAHSFIDGKRFYFERDINAFLNGASAVSDGNGGTFEEYAMLRLRLADGLCEKSVFERFGFPIPAVIKKAAERLDSSGLIINDDTGIRLTRKGFLLSNSVIAELLLCL